MSLRSEVTRIVNELLGNSKKISELPSAGSLAGDELVEIVQGGVNKRVTAASLSSGSTGNLAFGGFISSAPVGPLSQPTLFIASADFTWSGNDIFENSIITGDTGATNYSDYSIKP